MKQTIEQLLALAPVIPVLSIDDLKRALPMARALVNGGLPVLEVTLRTPQALDVIALIRRELPEAIVGAGTVLNRGDVERVVDAGVDFIVTPGCTPELLKAGAELDIPFMPGIATASELMLCLDHGFSAMKFFPAQAAGGVDMLRSLGGPFPSAIFCPTGGVSPDNLADYLGVPSVKTVGGSWLTPKNLVADEQWEAIFQLACAARDLVASIRNGAAG